jgi:Transcription initiation factor IIA, gamma subunit, helical domain
MSYQVYRQSKLGDCLVEALDELITNEKITPALAMKILAEVPSCHDCRSIRHAHGVHVCYCCELPQSHVHDRLNASRAGWASAVRPGELMVARACPVRVLLHATVGMARHSC